MVLIAAFPRAASVLLAALAVEARAAEIRIEAGTSAPHRVSAVGLSRAERDRLSTLDREGLAQALGVFTGDHVPSAGTPAVSGEYLLDYHGLHFRPRFPFVPDLRYAVRFAASFRSEPVITTFVAAPSSGPRPRVVAIFPSGETLPANTLRLYVHFSQPMEAHFVHRHLRLLDAWGAPVPLAFVEIEHGLWDPRQTRLTLLFHPGRIKRGVAPGEGMGPPLVAGREYRLVVSGGMSDTTGRTLGTDYERRFRAGPADRASPALGDVRVHPPATAASPLVVDLREPLDEALLHRLVRVEDVSGQLVAGAASTTAGERQWRFVPAQPWAEGSYALTIDPALEDRAGNRFDRLFDREIGGHETSSPASAPLSLRVPFTVGARARAASPQAIPTSDEECPAADDPPPTAISLSLAQPTTSGSSLGRQGHCSLSAPWESSA